MLRPSRLILLASIAVLLLTPYFYYTSLHAQTHALVLFLNQGRPAVLAVAQGKLVVAYSNHSFDADRAFSLMPLSLDESEADNIVESSNITYHTKAGFAIAANDRTYTNGHAPYRAALIPLWAIIALATISPVITVKHHRTRQTRKRNNQCQTCGYDLRATPQSCPECGTPVTPPT